MKIENLSKNNIKNLYVELDSTLTYSFAGLSGSGKSTFCNSIASESIRRLVLLLPKSEYSFLFSELVESDIPRCNIKKLPLILFLEKKAKTTNPRSTIGTHSGIYKDIRKYFAKKFNKSSEFFSFNNEENWCPKCKGRGLFMGNICTVCEGNRYDKSIFNYLIDFNGKKLSIVDFNKMSLDDLFEFKKEFNFASPIAFFIDNAKNLGIGYLSLERILITLSGGEYTRLILSEFLAISEGMSYIIDEPSLGLDRKSLYNFLFNLKNFATKNTISFIDHSDYVINSTQKTLFFGPTSGSNGGEIVDVSPRPSPVFIKKDEGGNLRSESFVFCDLYCRNIAIKKLEIPMFKVVAITGESGCGKSTLIKDCISKNFRVLYPDTKLIILGQDKHQSTSSQSTIFTFLELQSDLKKTNFSLKNKSLLELDKSHFSTSNFEKIELLKQLGFGYLTLDRQIKTLSTGEFQSLNLVSKFCFDKSENVLFILDEPTKGLSQNILNDLMQIIRSFVKTRRISIFLIEHNEYFLKSSDFIIDFGERKQGLIEYLKVENTDDYYKNTNEAKYPQVNLSTQYNNPIGIEISKTGDFQNKKNVFYGGLLSRLSSTADWIYGTKYPKAKMVPSIVLDLEEKLYSSHTFLYETGNILNEIFKYTQPEMDISSYDLFSSKNLCPSCKGKGELDSFDFDLVLFDKTKAFKKGLFSEELMKELKRYNFSKIEFLFKNIKKSIGVNLGIPYNKMDDKTKNIFWFGYLNEAFYDPKNNTNRQWSGFVHLIKKYLRSAKIDLKEKVSLSKSTILCPICKGFIMKESKPLDILGMDFKDILSKPLIELPDEIRSINIISSIMGILPSSATLLTDVSLLEHRVQVKLKILELVNANFVNFEISLNNVGAFYSNLKENLKEIALFNRIILFGDVDDKKTKAEIIKLNFVNKNNIEFKKIYEALSLDKIFKEISKLKQKNKCTACKGKGYIRNEGLDDSFDSLNVECDACNATGLSPLLNDLIVDRKKIDIWYNSKIKDLYNVNFETNLGNRKLTDLLLDLDKIELLELKKIKGISIC